MLPRHVLMLPRHHRQCTPVIFSLNRFISSSSSPSSDTYERSTKIKKSTIFRPPSCLASRNTFVTTASNKREFDKYPKPQPKEEPSFLIFPEVPSDTIETNEFLEIPTTGQIPFDALTVEKCVRSAGKLSIDFEHFIDEYSRTLNEEYEDKGVSNAKMNEFIAQMERHLLPLHYNLNLLNSFRIIRRNEFNFQSFDDFFRQRLTKTRLRYLNRYIYMFMCEMKARRDMWANEPENFENEKANDNMSAKSSAPASSITEALKDDAAKFEQQQKAQLVDRYVREAKILGIGLKHHDQLNVYNLLNENLSTEQQKFVQNASHATAIFQANIISPQFLDCLPDHVITQINHHDANSVFNSFMRYCPDQNLRKDFWLSYYSRASPYLGSTANNFLHIEKIRDSRYRKARLFGYENFASMAMDLRGSGGPTMAGSVENVRAFLNGLGMRTDARFETNMKELQDFATQGLKKSTTATTTTNVSANSRSKATTTIGGNNNNLVEKLNQWDLKYFERLFLREMYKIDSRDVRAHFPLERVVAGMLEFAERLFSIKIVEIKDEANGKVWGRNVRHFKVFGNSVKSNAEYGSFYFDPFQRESRILMPISKSDTLHTKPVVFFLMNFTAGNFSIFDQYDNQMLKSTGKELLNFSQVLDLFGKFGFVLQHLLTEVSCSEIGSLSNLEADAFHIVSHFMKMWPLNSYETLARCSSHIQTGEPISEEFFRRIRNSYYHFVSIALKNDLYLAALDLNLHTLREHVSSVQKQTWKEWMSPFDALEEDGHICSFSEIFSGNGLEGIYYSEKWAQVIGSDIFDAFRDARSGSMKSAEQTAALGARFKDTFLAQGGAVETNELFRRFLGRDPTLNGYLSINGFE